MSAQTGGEMADALLLLTAVEGIAGVVEFVASIAFTFALIVVWRVLRSGRLENREGLKRIGTGVGFLVLSVILSYVVYYVEAATDSVDLAINDVWYLVGSDVPALIGTYFVLSGARLLVRSQRAAAGADSHPDP